MEIKEALEIINGGYNSVTWDEESSKMYKEAVQTAVSHLETLQRVKEMGGVKKVKVDFGSGTNYDAAYANGFNEAINLKEAELAGKLNGLEDKIRFYCIVNLKIDITTEGAKKLAQAIQELILSEGKQ